MTVSIDERGRKLFAMMWTDQPGERAAACSAFVAHCKRLGLHPAELLTRASDPLPSATDTIADYKYVIKRKDEIIAERNGMIAHLERAVERRDVVIRELTAARPWWSVLDLGRARRALWQLERCLRRLVTIRPGPARRG